MVCLVIDLLYMKIVTKKVDMRFIVKTIIVKSLVLDFVTIDGFDKYMKIALIE